MKKLFIAASLIIGMIAGAMVLSSFSESKIQSNTNNANLIINIPTYWQGRAYGNMDRWVDIKVYETVGACNSFYAVIQDGNVIGLKIGDEVYVRNNPDYNPNRREKQYWKYFISYRNRSFYFDM